MTASLHDRIRAAAPALRGRLIADQPLAELTWFRVGGPAEVLFTPADEEDLALLLAALEPDLAAQLQGERVRWAVNGALASRDAAPALKDGDEIAFLPPVSGG